MMYLLSSLTRLVDMKKIINSLFVAIVTFAYASVYWLGARNMQDAESMTSLGYYKPYVYRQLVPMLARALESIGIRIDLAVVLIVTLSGVGFYLALRSLVALYHPMTNTTEIIVLLSVFAGMLLFGDFRMPYDLMTAALFTLAFLFIARGETRNYLLLFPFICLNRETAILLPIVYVAFAYVWKRGNLKQNSIVFVYSLGVYLLITLALRLYFAGNPGLSAWVEPWLNIQRFINHPAKSLLHLSGTIILLYLIANDWMQKPALLRIAFIFMFPILTGIYFIAGQSFEVRVYFELYPVIVLLALPVILEWITWLIFTSITIREKVTP